MTRTITTILAAALLSAAMLAGGCEANLARPAKIGNPTIALNLPEMYNTPDGMTVDAKNNIILSVPNINDPNQPAVMLSISPTDEITEIVKLPVHPDTKRAIPLGVAVGSDGNLYISDSQGFVTDEHKSRVYRVVMKDGKAEKVEIVVTGLVMANGLAAHGDWIFVCDSKLDPKAYPIPSGVYGFKISELSGDKPYQVRPGLDDPHLAIHFTTKNKDWQVGANGLGFDNADNMVVCNFGDAQLIRGKMGADGKVVSQKVVAEGQGMMSCDGLSVDHKSGDVYIADFLGNAVHRVNLATGKVTTIARNGNTDGADGSLDRPSEPCVRDGKVYVSNIDLPLAGNTYDKPHTVSVIKVAE
jgi:sugar lactone lactonase YvrE